MKYIEETKKKGWCVDQNNKGSDESNRYINELVNGLKKVYGDGRIRERFKRWNYYPYGLPFFNQHGLVNLKNVPLTWL